MQDRLIELRTVHRKHHVERVRVLAAPQRVFDMRNFFPVARIGIARIEDRTVIFAQIVHHNAESAVGREPDLMARREDLVELHFPVIVVDLGDRVLVRGVFVELQESHWIEIAFRIKNDLSAA